MLFMEEIHKLPFATIIKLRSDIAELVIDGDIEVNLQMLGLIHEWLLNNLDESFSVMVNRINSYSYAPEAHPYIGSLKGLKAIAEVVYSSATEMVVKDLANYPREYPWNVKCFSARQPALEWMTVQ